MYILSNDLGHSFSLFFLFPLSVSVSLYYWRLKRGGDGGTQPKMCGIQHVCEESREMGTGIYLRWVSVYLHALLTYHFRLCLVSCSHATTGNCEVDCSRSSSGDQTGLMDRSREPELRRIYLTACPPSMEFTNGDHMNATLRGRTRPLR